MEYPAAVMTEVYHVYVKCKVFDLFRNYVFTSQMVAVQINPESYMQI